MKLLYGSWAIKNNHVMGEWCVFDRVGQEVCCAGLFLDLPGTLVEKVAT